MLRDAFAQAWQVTADCCLGCTQQCRQAGGLDGVGPCVSQQDVLRYGDASPDLMYCVDALLDAFPDARVAADHPGRPGRGRRHAGRPVRAGLVQAGFRGHRRGVPAPAASAWRRKHDRAAWPGLSMTAKCAMRWRGSVRQMARLRARLAAEQLVTFRYEDVIRQPADAAAAISGFLAAAGARSGAARAGPPVAGRAGLLAPGAAARPGRGDRGGGRPGTPPGRLRRLRLGTGCPRGAAPAQSSWPANWVRYSSAYRPPAASSSSCVPRSATCPSSMTRIWSASRMVDSRCAMTSDVRPGQRASSARPARPPRTPSPGARWPRPGPPRTAP